MTIVNTIHRFIIYRNVWIYVQIFEMLILLYISILFLDWKIHIFCWDRLNSYLIIYWGSMFRSRIGFYSKESLQYRVFVSKNKFENSRYSLNKFKFLKKFTKIKLSFLLFKSITFFLLSLEFCHSNQILLNHSIPGDWKVY